MCHSMGTEGTWGILGALKGTEGTWDTLGGLRGVMGTPGVL